MSVDEPLSLDELNRRRKEIAAVTGKDYAPLGDKFPLAVSHRMMLSYLKKHRAELEEFLKKPVKPVYDEEASLRDEIAQLEYMIGVTSQLDANALIRPATEEEPVIVLDYKDFDLYPSSREELAQIAYEKVYYDAGNRESFRHVRHEWLPVIDAVLEALPEILKEDKARKTSTFEKRDSE